MLRYVYGDGRYWKFPQVGIVEIADDVEIGATQPLIAARWTTPDRRRRQAR